MKLLFMMIILLGGSFLAGCTSTPAPMVFDQEPIAPVELIDEDEPTFEPEIPVTTDDEIVTQPDTSL